MLGDDSFSLVVTPFQAVKLATYTQLLISAANAESFEDQMDNLTSSCFKYDCNVTYLKMQLHLLPDAIRKGCSQVKKVTYTHTICEAMNVTDVYKGMLPTMHQMLQLYVTFPITSTASEAHSKLFAVYYY